MILSAALIMCCRVFWQDIVQLTYHTVMQLVRMVPVVQHRRCAQWGLVLWLFSVCGGSGGAAPQVLSEVQTQELGAAHSLHSSTVDAQWGVLGGGSPKVNNNLLCLLHIERELTLYHVASWLTSSL